MNARLAHPDARQAGGGEDGEIGQPQALAGTPQRYRRIAIAARRQHAVTRIDGDKGLGAAGRHFHRIEGGNAVGIGRHRLADFDTLRQMRQQRGRIAAGAQGLVGGDRPAVEQGDRRVWTRRRQGVGDKRAPGSRGHVDRTRHDRLHARIGHGQYFGKRRQPRNDLAGIRRRGHCFRACLTLVRCNTSVYQN